MKIFRLLMALALGGLSGCSEEKEQWEVTVENRSTVPCTYIVTLGLNGAGSARVDALAAGKQVVLVVGNSDTVVHTIKTIIEKDEEELQPDLRLPVGKRCAIIVSPEGNVEARVEDR